MKAVQEVQNCQVPISLMGVSEKKTPALDRARLRLRALEYINKERVDNKSLFSLTSSEAGRTL